ncbi:hypothetical protein I4U23_022274 [Adineta vaga]|nr:hypothetical protein I4U23_022274 [Adineta vaga]
MYALEGHDRLMIRISFGDKAFFIVSNYDGSPKTGQPGNYGLYPSTWIPKSYGSIPPEDGIDDPEVMLLFLMEIVRRRIVDHKRNNDNGGLKDEYHDLSVGLGIAMACQLIRDNEINLGLFWENGDRIYIQVDPIPKNSI